VVLKVNTGDGGMFSYLVESCYQIHRENVQSGLASAAIALACGECRDSVLVDKSHDINKKQNYFLVIGTTISIVKIF
jgi:hypothetical protein